MSVLRIDTKVCISCNICREACPTSAVRLTPIDNTILYEIVEDRCDECAEIAIGPLCVEFCPVSGAIVSGAG